MSSPLATVGEVVVGCPVRERAWVMPSWFDHVEVALREAGVPGRYAFVVSAGDETLPVIAERAPGAAVTLVEEPGTHVERQWHLEARISQMVALRNLLLGSVRALAPAVFVSVDSDVLLHPSAIAGMLEGLGRFDAVGGCTYMTATGLAHPSCGWIIGSEGLRRQRVEQLGTFPVGVIMAIKAMAPAAYAVDYRFAREGEDIGWSLAAAHAGLRLGWDGRHPSKHVMSRAALGRVDERCGF
jgi:hypothetical protein